MAGLSAAVDDAMRTQAKVERGDQLCIATVQASSKDYNEKHFINARCVLHIGLSLATSPHSLRVWHTRAKTLSQAHTLRLKSVCSCGHRESAQISGQRKVGGDRKLVSVLAALTLQQERLPR